MQVFIVFGILLFLALFILMSVPFTEDESTMTETDPMSGQPQSE